MATSDGVGVEVFESNSGADSWSAVGTLKFDTIDPIVALDLEAHGDDVAILATEQSGSAFSFAQVASSHDGGRGWKTADAPSGGAIAYAGGWFWLVGGVMGDAIYRSKEGFDWAPVSVPVSETDWTAGPVTDTSVLGAVLPVTIHDQDRDSTVRFLATTDGGDSWAELGETGAPASASGSAVPTAVGPDGTWVVIRGESLVVGDVIAGTVSVVEPTGFPSDITKALLVGKTLTLVATRGSCPGGKASCTSATVVLQSTDLGQSWTELK